MKKLLSLILTCIIFSSIAFIPTTVSAEELKVYTAISSELSKKYWNGSWSIVKFGDWYYKFDTLYSSEAKKNYHKIVSVCGYDGNEKEITIPTEVDGTKINIIEDFYLISNTVETIKIPKEIIAIREAFDFLRNGNQYNGGTHFLFDDSSKLKEIVVDNENTKYKSQDGILFSKAGGRLCFYPPQKTGEEYTIPSGVKEIVNGALKYNHYLKSLTIPQNVRYIEAGAFSDHLEEVYFDNTNDIVYDTMRYLGAPRYYGPRVPNATVYCIYGTPLYEYYNKVGNDFLKELKAIPRKDGESLIKEDGVWYYYDNGEKTVRNTLIKHSGKWFYINNGVWDKTVTDKIIKYKDKWFYIKNGKWNSDVNTLIKLNGEWFGIVNGKWDTTEKTLVKYNGKWFYVKNGKWCKDTAIVKYKGKRFYVKKGKVDFDYSGTKKINGKTYKIKNGKVA